MPGQVFPLARKRNQIALGNSQPFSCQVSWCEKLVVGFGVAKKPLHDSFERFSGAVGVIPKQHFDQMNHFVLHDSLECLESVAADHTTDDRRRFIFESRKQRRRGDRDFKFSRRISAVARCLHRCHPAGACHACRKPKRKRTIGQLFAKPIDVPLEKILVSDVKQEPKIRATDFAEVTRADRVRIGEHVPGNRGLGLLSVGPRKLSGFDNLFEFRFGWAFARHFFFGDKNQEAGSRTMLLRHHTKYD